MGILKNSEIEFLYLVTDNSVRVARVLMRSGRVYQIISAPFDDSDDEETALGKTQDFIQNRSILTVEAVNG